MAQARLTDHGPGPYFEQALDAFARAAEASAGVVEQRYRLLGKSVALRFASEALADALRPALAHRRESTPADGPPDLVFHAWDRASTGVGLPAAGWPATAYGAKGVIDGFNDERFSTAYAPGVDIFNMLDHERGAGVFWFDDATEIPYWERGFPFRTLLHWSAAGSRTQLVHSGGVGLGDDAALITGIGGSGKSTTTLLCLEAGMTYSGDDYVAFELDDPPVLHSLYSSAKVDEASLGRFPALRPLVSNPGTDDEKSLLFLHPTVEGQFASGQRIRAVLLPRVTGERDTHLRPASNVAAVRALAPTTVFQLPRFDNEAFQLVVALSKSVPSYHLELGTDLAQIPPLVAAAIRGDV